MNNQNVEQWVGVCSKMLTNGSLYGAIVSPDRNVIEKALTGISSRALECRSLIVCGCPLTKDLLQERYFSQAYFLRVLSVVESMLGAAMPRVPPVTSAFLRFKMVAKVALSSAGRRCLLICSNLDKCLEAVDPSAIDDLCGNLVSISDNFDDMGVSYLFGSTVPIQEIERHKHERSPSSVYSRVRNFTLEDHS